MVGDNGGLKKKNEYKIRDFENGLSEQNVGWIC